MTESRSETLKVAWLTGRGVVAVGGAEARAFLQRIVTNDIDTVAPDRAVYAALLTPQGRFLHDFFVCQIGDSLFLDCEAARADDLARRLKVYRLRAPITIANESARYVAAALFGERALAVLQLAPEPGRAAAFGGGVVFVDPRLAALGARAVVPRGEVDPPAARGFQPTDESEYDRLRLAHGVPDGSRDLPVEDALLMEAGFDALNGLDWQKGCFIGQEVTARMRYRGLVKKRLLPVRLDGPAPEPGTPVMADGREVGIMRSGAGDRALALLRLEAVAAAAAGGAPLTAGGAALTAEVPEGLGSEEEPA